MQIIKYSKQLDVAGFIKRPGRENEAAGLRAVQQILNEVKVNGDEALHKYTLQFDKVDIASLAVSAAEIKNAVKQVNKKLKEAITVAYNNIYKFHKAQVTKPQKIETTKGVFCWRDSRPVNSVGIYVPGGSAPLFSTVLMLAIPAQIAGCKNIIMCTPPSADGSINPAILFAAQLCGVSQIYKTGGAQAIGAMAYGTEQIPVADKIFGPGNSYVTLAKQLVQQQGVAIDMPAGPSEVLVVADDSCVPAFVAADLLSQAEHGADSQVILIAFKAALVNKIQDAIQAQLQQLPRKEIAAAVLKNSKAIIVSNLKNATDIINAYAPEHLILAVKDTAYFIDKVYNAGSVFIGNYTPESAGDYASGTNHTLPTNGFAKVYSGVSVESFTKKITYQQISKKGLQKLGNVIETMAEAEQLRAHKNAVSIRLQKIKSGNV